MMVTVAISNMIGTGASSYIARCLGANERDKAAHTLTVAFTLTFINSIIVMGIGLGFLPALVRLLGAKDNTFIFTKQYVQVILIFLYYILILIILFINVVLLTMNVYLYYLKILMMFENQYSHKY